MVDKFQMMMMKAVIDRARPGPVLIGWNMSIRIQSKTELLPPNHVNN